MIANTRVPPPPISQENPVLSHSGLHLLPKMMGSNPSYPPVITQYQQQQQPQQQKLLSTGQIPPQQQQIPATHAPDQEPQNENNQEESSKDSFEIGTFDPNAYEV